MSYPYRAEELLLKHEDDELVLTRGDGSIILTIDSKLNLNSCSFFVLRPAEWRQTVSPLASNIFRIAIIAHHMWIPPDGPHRPAALCTLVTPLS
jgi:hypothetical protein